MSCENIFRFQIYTHEYERVLEFYKTILNYPILIKRETSFKDRVTVFSAASGQIEVIYASDAEEIPSSFGWTIQIETSDVDIEYKRIKNLGYTIQREPEDKFWGHRNFKVLDPSGLEITIFSKL